MPEPLITRRRLIGRGASAAAVLGLGSLLAACLAGAAMNGRRLFARARRFLEL